MKRFAAPAVAAGVIGLMLVVGSASSAPAAKGSSGDLGAPGPTAAQGKASEGKVSPEMQIRGLKLRSTALSAGNLGATVPAGFVALDAPLVLNCPGHTTCTFAAEQNVQVKGSTSSNGWAICTKVDGNYMSEPSCPFLGYTGSTFYVGGSFSQSQTGFTPGNHTVQTEVYSSNGMDVYNYAINYRVYTP